MKKFCRKRYFSFFLLIVISALFISQNSFAQKKKDKKIAEQTIQDYGNTVNLIVTGTGPSKEIAIQNALRTAIEKTFGSFVSANSSIVNDELVKDEIVTVSSGNIKTFEELNCHQLNGNDGVIYEVTVQTEVSIDNLIRFAQNHGMSAELAGNTFAMNVKLDALYAANENEALSNLIIQLYKIAKLGLYDFKIDVKEPSMEGGLAMVEAYVLPIPNANYKAYVELAKKTLRGLSNGNASSNNRISFGWKDKEISERTGMIVNEDFFTTGLSGFKSRDDVFHLRNNVLEFHSAPGNELYELANGANFIYWFERFKYLSKFAFGIKDNIGHRVLTTKENDELQVLSYTSSGEPNEVRRNGSKKEYEHKLVSKVVGKRFTKFGSRYDLQRGYAGYDYASAYFNMGYSLNEITNVSKIEVFPQEINLLDNELLMDILITNPDPKKMLEEGNHCLDLADDSQGDKRNEYLREADRKFEIAELMILNVEKKNEIKKVRNQIKNLLKDSAGELKQNISPEIVAQKIEMLNEYLSLANKAIDNQDNQSYIDNLVKADAILAELENISNSTDNIIIPVDVQQFRETIKKAINERK